MAVEGCAVMVLGVEVCVTVEITGSSTEVAVTATEDCCSCRSPGEKYLNLKNSAPMEHSLRGFRKESPYPQ